MTENQRMKLQYLVNRHPQFLAGTLEDIIRLHEMWCLRIGVDDEWLDAFYERHQEK